MAHREQHSNREAKSQRRKNPKGARELSLTGGPSERFYRETTMRSTRRRRSANPSGRRGSQCIDGLHLGFGNPGLDSGLHVIITHKTSPCWIGAVPGP
jgi:hypothetical protein